MRHVRKLFLPLVLLLALAAPAAQAASPSGLVVSQVYAGGGNSGALYQNDYVELFNAGSAAVDLAGWTVQYASASSTSWQPTALSGTIQPGHAYLVQLASTAAVGALLPAPDATGTSNLAASGGKVALVHDTVALACGASAGSCAGNAAIADLVGYGSAADYEGSGPAPALDATSADIRAGEGCVDTDVNASDFSAGAPAPRNSASAAVACSAPATGPGDAAVDLDVQPLLTVSLDHPSLSFGTVAPGETPAPLPETVTVASNDAAGYTLTVHRTSFDPFDLPLGLAAVAPAGGSLGAGLGGSAVAAIPVSPSPDLLVGSTSTLSAAGCDAWAISIGFTGPLPVVGAGHYGATVTYTVIGR